MNAPKVEVYRNGDGHLHSIRVKTDREEYWIWGQHIYAVENVEGNLVLRMANDTRIPIPMTFEDFVKEWQW